MAFAADGAHPGTDAPALRHHSPYVKRLASPGDYGHLKRLMATDQGRAFSDEDLSAIRHDLEKDPKVRFHLLEDGAGRPIGFISTHADEVVTFRGYYFEPGKKDLKSLVGLMAQFLDEVGKDGHIAVCPPYHEILPVLEQELGDRVTTNKMTDAGDWVEVTIRHRPVRQTD